MVDAGKVADRSQLGLDLGLPDLPTPPLAAASVKPKPKRSSAAPSQSHNLSAPPDALTIEEMAQQVEAHLDYQVARRLVPSVSFAGQPQGPVKRVAVLDTETTGLQHHSEKIIELALVVVDIDTVTGLPVGDVVVYDGFEDPGRTISPEIQALTGISNDMVRGKSLDLAEINQVMAGVDWVVAHNAAFDRPFVEGRLSFFADLPWACSFADIDWRQHGQSSAKLEALAASCGVFYDAHRADMDCHALMAVLSRVVGDTQQTGWQHLLHALDAPHYSLQATGAPFDAKDTLKARGYRWDSQARVWHTKLRDTDALEAECAWLATQVYANPRAQVTIVESVAVNRYAGREGKTSVRPVAP